MFWRFANVVHLANFGRKLMIWMLDVGYRMWNSDASVEFFLNILLLRAAAPTEAQRPPPATKQGSRPSSHLVSARGPRPVVDESSRSLLATYEGS